MRTLLEQFHDWMAQTVEELDREADSAMSQESSSGAELVSHSTCIFGPTTWTEQTTRHDETVCLEPPADSAKPQDAKRTEHAGPSDVSLHDDPLSALPQVGLRQLVEAFTAMRHDVKLQTKSARSLENALQPAIAGLETAMRQFQAIEAREREAADRAMKPFVETLISLDEAFMRGEQAFQRLKDRVEPKQAEQSPPKTNAPTRLLDRWQQGLVRTLSSKKNETNSEATEKSNSEELAHALEGFALIQARIQRALEEHAITRIDAVGRFVDTAEMTVVELVDSSHVKAETVVEEVRPGYKWRNHVIRFAEVRAVRGE